MKILIVDDEPPARNRLRSMLQELGYEELDEAAHGRQALQRLTDSPMDVVLLDIRMPGMDGMEVAAHLNRVLDAPPAVIFTTAYDDYALSAFQSHAVDYLLKPIRRDDLQQALHAATRLNRAQLQVMGQIEIEQQREPSHISARIKGNIRLVPVEDIFYFHAEHKYVNVGYRGGQVLIEDSLTLLEQRFAQRFMRIHRNALVANDYISALEKQTDGQTHIRLKECDTTLEVSRRHLSTVRKFMKQ